MGLIARHAVRVVFLGTPEFAVPSLAQVVAAGHAVLLAVTQPDRPKGRHHLLTPPPVKAAAEKHGIPVYQPERIKHLAAIERLRDLAPDAMIVVGYGQIVPQSIIDIAALGMINVHASLLPELRGAAPVQWAIARGYTRTGVTTMQVSAGLDAGDILLQWETPIGPDETAVELSARLAIAGADLLVQTLAGLAAGAIKPSSQDEAQITWAPILKKDDGRINWNKPAQEIHNLIRGLQPWPGAVTTFRGQSLHLWRSRLAHNRWNLPPGALIARTGCSLPLCAQETKEHGVFAVGGDGAALEVLELQLEGRKRMPAETFVNGYRLTDNDRLGA